MFLPPSVPVSVARYILRHATNLKEQYIPITHHNSIEALLDGLALVYTIARGNIPSQTFPATFFFNWLHCIHRSVKLQKSLREETCTCFMRLNNHYTDCYTILPLLYSKVYFEYKPMLVFL